MNIIQIIYVLDLDIEHFRLLCLKFVMILKEDLWISQYSEYVKYVKNLRQN